MLDFSTFESLFGPQHLSILLHLLAAVLAGGAIGFERSYHGRPAGFRTHTLVCVGSSLLMLITVFQGSWMPSSANDAVHIDPTRMAQGIMTGIGFLGAGVIYKEGISVRGLTTAASIWVTAAIGVLMGTGLFYAGTLATLITLGILSSFHKVERRMPKQSYVHHQISFKKGQEPAEDSLKAMLKDFDFTIGNLSYHVLEEGRVFEYRMVIRTRDTSSINRYAKHLSRMDSVREFSLAPSGD